jgi:hypothetical protein
MPYPMRRLTNPSNRSRGYAFAGHRAKAAEPRLLLDQAEKTAQNDLPTLEKKAKESLALSRPQFVELDPLPPHVNVGYTFGLDRRGAQHGPHGPRQGRRTTPSAKAALNTATGS